MNTKIIIIILLFSISSISVAIERDFSHYDHLQEMKKRQPGVKPASVEKKKIYTFKSPEIEIKVEKNRKGKPKLP